MSVSSGSDVTIPIQDSPPPPPSPYANRAEEHTDGSENPKTPPPTSKTPTESQGSQGQKGIDNEGFQNDNVSNGTNGTKRSVKSGTGDCKITMNGGGKGQEGGTAETLNSELINLNILNTIPQKPSTEYGPYENFDEYFIPVNQHKKYMRRSEKLYVTKDKRKSRNTKKYACWIIGGLLLSVIVTIAILSGLGLIQKRDSLTASSESVLGSSPTTLEPSSSSPTPASSRETTFVGSSFSTSSSSTNKPASDTYVPSALDVQFTLENATYEAVLYNKSTQQFQELAFQLEEEIKSALREYLGIDVIFAKVTEFLPGSIIVKMKIGWLDEEQNDRVDEVKAYLMTLKLIGHYTIRPGTFVSYGIVNMCKFQKAGCSHFCSFDYETLDVVCSCPELMLLAPNRKICLDSDSAQMAYSSTEAAASSSASSEDGKVPDDENISSSPDPDSSLIHFPTSSSSPIPSSSSIASTITNESENIEIITTTTPHPHMITQWVSHPSTETIPLTSDPGTQADNGENHSSEKPISSESTPISQHTTENAEITQSSTSSPATEMSSETPGPSTFHSSSHSPPPLPISEEGFTMTPGTEMNIEPGHSSTEFPHIVMDQVTSHSTEGPAEEMQTAGEIAGGPLPSSTGSDFVETSPSTSSTTGLPTQSTQIDLSKDTLSTVDIRNTDGISSEIPTISTSQQSSTESSSTPISLLITDLPASNEDQTHRINNKNRRFETVEPIIVSSLNNDTHLVDSTEVSNEGRFDLTSGRSNEYGGESVSSSAGSNESNGVADDHQGVLPASPELPIRSDEHPTEYEREIEEVTEHTTIEPISLINDTLVNEDENITEDTLNTEPFTEDRVVAANMANMVNSHSNPEQFNTNEEVTAEEEEVGHTEQPTILPEQVKLPTDVNAEIHVQGHPIDPPQPTFSSSEATDISREIEQISDFISKFTTPSPLNSLYPGFSTTLKILPNIGRSSTPRTSDSEEVPGDNHNEIS